LKSWETRDVHSIYKTYACSISNEQREKKPTTVNEKKILFSRIYDSKLKNSIVSKKKSDEEEEKRRQMRAKKEGGGERET
jgi:hypothetical protein